MAAPSAQPASGDRGTIGDIIGKHRNAAKLSLRKLESLTAIPYSTIHSIEKGGCRVTADHIKKLAQVLGAAAAKELTNWLMPPRET